MSRDDRWAIAADPDRDLIWITDIVSGTMVKSIELRSGDEPGRLVEDDAHRVHVALRRSGQIATIDLESQQLVSRRTSCAEPRGIAFDPATGLLHVACVSGELWSFTAMGETPTRKIRLPDDLRDVVVQGDKLWVSRFRSAEILVVGAAGRLENTIVLPMYRDSVRGLQFAPAVAYRMAPLPLGGVALLHQRAATNDVHVEDPAGGYGGGSPCNAKTVHTTITMIGTDGKPDDPAPYLNLIVAVDLALSPDGYYAVAASPGHANGHEAFSFVLSDHARSSGVCASGSYLFHSDLSDKGEIIAVAFDSHGNTIVQSREPAAIHVTPIVSGPREGTTNVPAFQGTIALDGAKSVADFGHAVFHRDGGGGVACASCHPEGRDDGRTWAFMPIGARRTQSLRISLAGTAPFHWDGNFASLDDLVGQVFVKRMSGPSLTEKQTGLLTHWVTEIPTIGRDPARDVDSAERGRTLFMSSTVGCAACHAGGKYTNNTTVDVGTGGKFQVPSLLGVGARAPYLHSGCAPTLRDRFGACGGGDLHGNTSALTQTDIDDLVSFLETI